MNRRQKTTNHISKNKKGVLFIFPFPFGHIKNIRDIKNIHYTQSRGRHDDNMPGVPYLRGFLASKQIKTNFLDLNFLIKNDTKICSLILSRIFSQIKYRNLSVLSGIKNADFLKEYLKEKIDASSYEKIGFSIYSFEQLIFSFLVIKLLKIDRDAIIFGGPFISNYYQELADYLKNDPLVGYLIIKEAETPLYLLLKKTPVKKIPNLIYFSKGKYILAKSLDHSENPENLPAPLYDNKKFHAYYVGSNRSCYWGKCIFCHHLFNFSKKASREKKSPESVFQDVKGIIEKNKNKKAPFFIFTDCSLDPDFLKLFSEKIIQSRLKAGFGAFMRLDERLDLGTIKLAKKAGFKLFSFGLETTSERLLKIIRKGISLKKSLKIIENCGKAGIEKIVVHFMLGLPTQTAKELHEDLDMMHELITKNKNVILGIKPLYLGKNTVLYEHSKKYKIKPLMRKEAFNKERIPFVQLKKDAISPKEALILFKRHPYYKKLQKRNENYDVSKKIDTLIEKLG